ncbi:hypothetical protein BDY21DRAFT_390692 [Lineolata rhizophorae]|uniref:Uncharacterized protein n=1 Tax=Lineolata rhizophorae TaxID=578093 RepID=A0A6A6P1V4_9PEZI|nr:hypothetical protein BDY21DRAFT_390692 [Lineolata rhizophorae]
MAWFSILPENLSFFELWAARIFLFLGLLTIAPWVALIIYDFLLYCWRSLTYELPVCGGRARGKQRPRAPSLTERPGGERRRFSLAMPTSPVSASGSAPGGSGAEWMSLRQRDGTAGGAAGCGGEEGT